MKTIMNKTEKHLNNIVLCCKKCETKCTFKKKRTPMPELEVEARIKSMIEVDLVITEKDAAYESERCLGCCRICYNPETDFPIAEKQS